MKRKYGSLALLVSLKAPILQCLFRFNPSSFSLPLPMPIRVHLPFHLRTIAQVDGEVRLEIAGAVTQRAILDALEERYPALCGTIRDHATRNRRAFVRFFVCQEDWSNESPDRLLPTAIASGSEPFLVIGALAGG